MNKDPRQQWEDVVSKANEAGAVLALAEILADKEGRCLVSHLGRKEAEICIGVLDRGVTEHDLTPPEKNTFFAIWRRLAERHGLLPDRLKMTEKIEASDETIGSGGFADVRSGRYMGRLVAVKTTRVGPWTNLQKIRKRFYRGVILWSTLYHPNVLKLVGAQEDMKKQQFFSVSDWMEHGSIMEYIETTAANRLELLHGAAQGLEYLHGIGLAHGNLKGRNILVSNDAPPRACLDVSPFMTVAPDPVQSSECSAQPQGCTVQFMAPELLVPEMFGEEGSVPTQQADIYAFGLVIFQVLTGKTPFRGVPQTAMGYYVLRGERPEKPENATAIGFSDSLWGFTKRCWDGLREARPTAGEVVAHLGAAAANWGKAMPPCPPQAEDVIYDSESMSDSGEFNTIQSPLTDVQESPTKPGANPGPFSYPSTPSMQ